MENENKWEYDYSASNNETGYPNVGSSGMNTANQYNEDRKSTRLNSSH